MLHGESEMDAQSMKTGRAKAGKDKKSRNREKRGSGRHRSAEMASNILFKSTDEVSEGVSLCAACGYVWWLF